MNSLKKTLTRTLIAAAFTASAVVATPSAALATHTGPYVLNADNTSHYALVRGHDGLRRWVYITGGQSSGRGAEGFNVPVGTRIKYQRIATGQILGTACGQYLPTWTGAPYQALNNYSVRILDWSSSGC